jgi:hypothetical protein
MTIVTGTPSQITKLIQSNFLQKAMMESLKPKLRYRREAVREMLEGRQMGETITQTRRGLMTPVVAPTTPGNDPAAGSYTIEQWTATMSRYTGRYDTRLPNSAVQIVNQFLEDATALTEQGGWSVDRLARNALYRAYLSGQTTASAAGSTATALPVNALNGFRFAPSGGVMAAVSGSNTLAITVGGTAAVVTGASPVDSTFPDGPGTLTLQSAISWSDRAAVVSSIGPFISRPSGVSSVDGFDGTKVLTYAMLLEARERLQLDRVPTFSDGTYHVHLDPTHLKHLLSDSAFKQLFQGQPSTTEMREGILIRQLGLTFMENTDNPSFENTTASLQVADGSAIASKEIGAEVKNTAGKRVKRSIILGQGSLREFWIPESAYLAEMAGRMGPYGYQGRFLDGSGGFEADLDGIRYVLRPPQDYLLDVVSQAWSFTGDWVAPTDLNAPSSPAVYKRAVVMESDA